MEVLLGHPGGPLFAHRDDGVWSIPKGEYLPEEEPLAAAYREFAEEIGLAPPDGEAASSGGGADVIAARLSRSELNALVASLPDEALGHLVLAAVRQLRRRLARAGRVSLRGRGDAGRTSVLERSAQQLIAELSEGGHDDDDWGAG